MDVSRLTQIIDFDSLDKEIFNNAVSISEGLKKLINKGGNILPHFNNFVFDLFLCFYKAEILFNDEYEDRKSSNIYKAFINNIYRNTFLKFIRNDTFLNDTKSAVATVMFGSSVIDWFKSNNYFSKKSIIELSEINMKEEQIEYIKNELNVIKETKEKSKNKEIVIKLGLLENEKEIEIHKMNTEIEESFNNLSNKIEDNNSEISKFINSSLIEMDEKMSDYYSNSTIFEDNRNPLSHSDAGKKIDLAHKLIENDKLRKLANMLGSLKDVMSSVRNKNWKSRTDEIYSINLGSDIGRAISSEIIKLGNHNLKKEFLKKYLNEELQQYHLKDNSSKGPFVICLDCSSSMSGDKEIWSKGVALTLAETARKQKRKCDILAFTSRDYEIKHFDLKTTALKAIDSSEFVSVAEYFPGGGTDFEKPLSKALDLLKSSKSNKADIILITDGEARISDDWLRLFNQDKKKYEFKVYSILVDITGKESQETLRKFSDKITSIDNLTAKNSKKIFINI